MRRPPGQRCDAGLRVEQGVAGLGTAFRAALAGGRAGRRVGIAALYNAVTAVREDGSIEAVHSCGHGLIAGAVVGAALALAPLRGQPAGDSSSSAARPTRSTHPEPPGVAAASR